MSQCRIFKVAEVCQKYKCLAKHKSYRVLHTYLGDLKNSGLGHFWEIFLGGDGMGLLTSAENLEKFGKIWKNAKIQGGGTRSKLGGGGQTFPKNFGGPPYCRGMVLTYIQI